jgi:hypothetical protein
MIGPSSVSNQETCVDSRSATSSPVLEVGAEHCDSQGGQTTSQCGQVVARVSRSAPQAEGVD